jgi:hypothetical protein
MENESKPAMTVGPHPDAEHPAARAARMVKELHQRNINLIDNGHVFTRDGENVNEQMRAASIAEMAKCDEIIRIAPGMSKELTIKADAILGDLKEVMDGTVLEIADYDHKETD